MSGIVSQVNSTSHARSRVSSRQPRRRARRRWQNRGADFTTELEELAALETRRRRLLPEIEGLKREQNAAGDEVARAKRQGLDTTTIQEANRARNQQIKQLERRARRRSSSGATAGC